MPSFSSERPAHQFDVFNELTASSRLPLTQDDEDFESRKHFDQRSSQSSIIKFLSRLHLYGPQLRREEFDLDEVPILGNTRNHRLENPFRKIRRCRRWICPRQMGRGLCALSLLILLFFGVLHVLEVIVGRAHLFWNRSVYEQSFLGRHSFLDNPASFRGYDGDIRQAMVPIPCHSHNDYWRDEPLFEAIRWGCIGVEADVWLFEGELYVGHTEASLEKNRTLRTLYIDPLLELLDTSSTMSRALSHSSGVFHIMPGQTLVLLIDFKNSPEEAFRLVQQQIQPLRERELISYWDGKKVFSKALTVVATGDATLDMVVSNSTHRDIFLDAPLDALWEPPRKPIGHSDSLHSDDRDVDYGTAMSTLQNQNAIDSRFYNATTSYYASTSFQSSVGFVWRGHISPRQMDIIRGQIRGAKRRGLKARYWGTPTWPTSLRNHVWHVLIKEGADVLSVDDLKAAALQDWTIPVHDNPFW